MLIQLETIDTKGLITSRWWANEDPIQAKERWERRFNRHRVRVTEVNEYPTKYKIGQRVRVIAELPDDDSDFTMNPATCGKVGVILECHEDDGDNNGASYLVQFTDDITVDGKQWTWDFEADLPIGQSMLYDSEIEGSVVGGCQTGRICSGNCKCDGSCGKSQCKRNAGRANGGHYD